VNRVEILRELPVGISCKATDNEIYRKPLPKLVKAACGSSEPPPKGLSSVMISSLWMLYFLEIQSAPYTFQDSVQDTSVRHHGN
jgi:hypothetical protein